MRVDSTAAARALLERALATGNDDDRYDAYTNLAILALRNDESEAGLSLPRHARTKSVPARRAAWVYRARALALTGAPRRSPPRPRPGPRPGHRSRRRRRGHRPTHHDGNDSMIQHSRPHGRTSRSSSPCSPWGPIAPEARAASRRGPAPRRRGLGARVVRSRRRVPARVRDRLGPACLPRNDPRGRRPSRGGPSSRAWSTASCWCRRSRSRPFTPTPTQQAELDKTRNNAMQSQLFQSHGREPARAHRRGTRDLRASAAISRGRALHHVHRPGPRAPVASAPAHRHADGHVRGGRGPGRRRRSRPSSRSACWRPTRSPTPSPPSCGRSAPAS